MSAKVDPEALPINTYEQVGKGGVFLHKRGRHGARDVTPSAWQVCRPGYQTDPCAAWYFQGNKSFTYLGPDGSERALDEAKAWASARYGIKNWKRNRMGDWIDADANLPPLRPIERKKRNA